LEALLDFIIFTPGWTLFNHLIHVIVDVRYSKASDENKAVFKGAKYLLLKNCKKYSAQNPA